MRIFVDIDNTICNTSDKHDYDNSTPISDNIAKINKLFNDGNEIIYWTARGSGSGLNWTAFTKVQIDGWGCLYHELRLGKPSFDLFIDDKAIRIEEL